MIVNNEPDNKIKNLDTIIKSLNLTKIRQIQIIIGRVPISAGHKQELIRDIKLIILKNFNKTVLTM